MITVNALNAMIAGGMRICEPIPKGVNDVRLGSEGYVPAHRSEAVDYDEGVPNIGVPVGPDAECAMRPAEINVDDRQWLLCTLMMENAKETWACATTFRAHHDTHGKVLHRGGQLLEECLVTL